eukprot:TRINITY_DN8463_c0_g1_i4.p1 TRINITY_DN8463_c0_g1~~TRINITY_DN8463_c0_g1_i4.p1  ORF type:complete len:498 (+),score=75.35 TRINITY_DN8463_c0_g1_i4:81-1574(+)
MAGKPSSASLIDLRAELARKQAQFRQEKQNPELKDARVERQRARQAAAWLKSNKGVLKRSQQDLIQNAKDTKSLLKVEAALKAKTALYEKLRQGQMSDIEQERYLVDFEQKFFNLRYRETEAERDRRENADNRPPTPVDDDEEDEWVDFVDEFGRNRRCLRRDLPKHNLAPSGGEAPQSQQFVRPGNQSADARTSTSSHDLLSADMQRDMARQAWEEREREALEKSHHGPVHYETVREKEVRNLGTAYFQFSTDAEQREEQMSTLNSLRDQVPYMHTYAHTMLSLYVRHSHSLSGCLSTHLWMRLAIGRRKVVVSELKGSKNDGNKPSNNVWQRSANAKVSGLILTWPNNRSPKQLLPKRMMSKRTILTASWSMLSNIRSLCNNCSKGNLGLKWPRDDEQCERASIAQYSAVVTKRRIANSMGQRCLINARQNGQLHKFNTAPRCQVCSTLQHSTLSSPKRQHGSTYHWFGLHQATFLAGTPFTRSNGAQRCHASMK